MIIQSDLIRLPFTPDLTQAGILFVCKEVALGRIQDSRSREPLQQIIGDIGAELVFRRYLDGLHLRFKVQDVRPVSLPGKGEVILGGRGCHLVNRLVDPQASSRMDADLDRWLLQTRVSLSRSEVSSDRLADHDLLVFNFILLRPRRGQQERQQDPQSLPSGFWLCRFPTEWNRSPGTLSFRSQHDVHIELGGMGFEGEYLNEELHLLPGQVSSPSKTFRSIAYLSTQRPITGILSVSLPRRNPVRIGPSRWQNLWLEAGEIMLAGYTPVGEFRRQAQRAELPVAELYPLRPLFDIFLMAT